MSKVIYTKDELVKMTPKREKMLQEYVALQEDFKELHNKGLLKYVEVNYDNEELDIDKLSKSQQKTFDEATEFERDKMLKTFPQTMVSYPLFLLFPFEVQNQISRKVETLDNIQDDALKVINKRISDRVNMYRSFLDTKK